MLPVPIRRTLRDVKRPDTETLRRSLRTPGLTRGTGRRPARAGPREAAPLRRRVASGQPRTTGDLPSRMCSAANDRCGNLRRAAIGVRAERKRLNANNRRRAPGRAIGARRDGTPRPREMTRTRSEVPAFPGIDSSAVGAWDVLGWAGPTASAEGTGDLPRHPLAAGRAAGVWPKRLAGAESTAYR